MAEALSTAEIDREAGIPDEDLHAAVDAVLEATACSSKARLFMLGENYRLDVTAAVTASEQAVKALADPNATNTSKRALIWAALTVARPERS